MNVVDKAVFEGSWYMGRTVIDVGYEASGLGTFVGDAASDLAGGLTALPRIRWVIEEDLLLAYRDYELVAGGDGEAREPGAHQGEPVAAYAIDKHLDIRRAYNPTTGEERNVVVENDTDRPWHARQYMRVDWSENRIAGAYAQSADLEVLFGSFERTPAALFVQDASQLPEAYAPQFHRMRCTGPDDPDCPAYERDLAHDYAEGELYHMSFVSQEVLTPAPGGALDRCGALGGPACSAIAAFVRSSFLKVSDQRQYQPTGWVDDRFERFGFFRVMQRTVDRQTGRPDDPAFGETDFLNYSVNRHNLWQRWHDEEGQPIPYAEREVRPIVWYTSQEMPAHLIRPSFDVVGQWNEALMQTVRRLRGEPLPVYPEVTCQDTDPDAYCYCQRTPGGALLNATCPGRYDPFEAPDAYGDGTEHAYDCYVEVPEGAEPNLDQADLGDADFHGWFDARFVGDECVSLLRVNTCNQRALAERDDDAEPLDCQQRGDLRFKLLSYIDQPGTPFLGIATLRGDPVSGEIISGDANIGGPALDKQRTQALQTYDLIQGRVSDAAFLSGEDVRGYFEALGHSAQPALPRFDLSPSLGGAGASALDAASRAAIDTRMAEAAARLRQLQGASGRSQIYSDRLAQLAGTQTERRMVEGRHGLLAPGTSLPAGVDAHGLPEDVLAQVSPYRPHNRGRLAALLEAEESLSRHNVMLPHAYVDDAVRHYVTEHADWPRARLEIALNRLLYRQTQLHELGHCLGLRHNFGASADRPHYHPEHAAIEAAIPLPDPAAFDSDGEAGLSVSERMAYAEALREARSAREQSGIDGWMSASVMDYASHWYERLQPLGRYDHAAVAFGYGDLVEAYRGAPAPDAPRVQLTYYQGGETCEEDADCPYAREGARADALREANLEAGLTQRCEPTERAPSAKTCSSLDAQLEAAGRAGDAALAPLRYRFCSDERAGGGGPLGTLGWCNRFDEGASYRDIVRNVSEAYDRSYLFRAFRRYDRSFSVGSYASELVGRYLGILDNVFRSLVARYAQEPAPTEGDEAFGFYDHYLATVDVLNLYARILGQPDVGGYSYDEGWERYVQTSSDGADPTADLQLPLGQTKLLWSDYQRGLTGIERYEYVGTYYDKLLVLDLMTARDLGAAYGRDVPFFANMYDLFPGELEQIFSGLIRDVPGEYMPRVYCPDGGEDGSCGDGRLLYMDFYQGDCSEVQTCRPDPTADYAGLDVVESGNLVLQVQAAILALAQFPVFFDTSFQNQMLICVEGQGDCHVPSGAAVLGEDYIRYASDRFGKRFLSFAVQRGGRSTRRSVGFALLEELDTDSFLLDVLLDLQAGETVTPEAQARLDALGYTPPAALSSEITRLDRRVQELESFLFQLIQLQRDLGIAQYVVR